MIKKQVFKNIENAVAGHTIITSNTSAIPISVLQEELRLPNRFFGLHWSVPAHTTRSVEIICGNTSDQEQAKWLYQLSHFWGKEPMLLRKDIRGFIRNRLMYALYREAFYLVENGYSSIEDVDRACRNGPGNWITFAGCFRWMDLTGVPAYHAVMQDLFPTLCNGTEVPKLIDKIVKSGGQGIINGNGFYQYTTEEARLWQETHQEFSYDIRELAQNLLIQSINHFEQIPNELIYEIFDFLDISHVYNAFSNLNTRFENLLTNSSFCFNINISSMSKSTFEHYYTNIINPNKHRIKLLHLSNPFTVDRIFSPVRIALKFIRLETLIFDNIQSKYLPNILHHFISLPNLRCLILISIDSVRNLNNIYYQIFRLPTLKYCKLSLKEHVESQLLPMATDTISPIEHLVITNTIYFYELLTLLSYVPQLRRLSIHCLDGSQSMFKNLFHQLQVLHISTSYDETYLNASQWEKWILSYMSNLHIFDFQYINSIQNAASDNNQLIYDDVIKQFSSLFWSERKWFFAYHFYRKEYRDHVIFYSTDPYRRKQYTLYKPLDKKICPRHQETNVDVVNHIDIQGEQAMMSCINYFSNPTELTLSNSFYESRIWLRVILNRIISLKQLTKLIINCTDFRFDQFINLLRLTPNIHTLILDCQSINYIDTVSIDHTDNFQFVSNTNTITNMIIKRISSMKNIKLFIALCPRLQHLTIDINSMDFEPIVEFLLSRNNSHTRHLFSLCMKHRIVIKLVIILVWVMILEFIDDDDDHLVNGKIVVLFANDSQNKSILAHCLLNCFIIVSLDKQIGRFSKSNESLNLNRKQLHG
ncbi:unnamed protein product [Rotaria sp. Silwood1]|nr:unnamed protein product [Rotaria sp. Silwood1]